MMGNFYWLVLSPLEATWAPVMASAAPAPGKMAHFKADRRNTQTLSKINICNDLPTTLEGLKSRRPTCWTFVQKLKERKQTHLEREFVL